MAAQYVFLLDIAKYTGRTLSGMADKARRAGMAIVKLRRSESGKAALAVKPEDAKRLISMETPKAEILRPEDLFD